MEFDSEYEAQRAKRIEENRKFLESLGLQKIVPESVPKGPNKKEKESKKDEADWVLYFINWFVQWARY